MRKNGSAIVKRYQAVVIGPRALNFTKIGASAIANAPANRQTKAVFLRQKAAFLIDINLKLMAIAFLGRTDQGNINLSGKGPFSGTHQGKCPDKRIPTVTQYRSVEIIALLYYQ